MIHTRTEMEQLTVKALRPIAASLSITGTSRMRKDEIISAIIATEDALAVGVEIEQDHAEAVAMTTTAKAAPTVEIHTAGELHLANHPLPLRPTFTFNLSELLDDPDHKPSAQLVKLDGTDSRVIDFVFASDGAQDLFYGMEYLIKGQLVRGKNITVLILCRGGRHRSVAFGEELAELFNVTATHHHRHLDVVR